MSSTSNNHYIQAETSTRIDACFGGVVVQSPGNKFQYFQDRNKRWPFTCSEKGCACFFFLVVVVPIFSSLSFFFVKRARLVRVCVRRFVRGWCVDVCRRRRRARTIWSGVVSCFLFVLRARRIFLFLFFFRSFVCSNNNNNNNNNSDNNNGLTFSSRDLT